MLGTLVAAAYHDLLGIVQITLGNALNVAAHGSREEQRVPLLRHLFQYLVDALLESHVQHLVGLVQHHVLHIVQLCHAAFHQVDETAGSGYDNLHTLPQGTYLLFDAGTAIDRLDVDAVQVFAKVAQVIGNLQAQLSCRSENQGQRQTSSHFA